MGDRLSSWGCGDTNHIRHKKGTMATKTGRVLTILGLDSLSNASLPSPEMSGSLRSGTRNPRLFYVSSTTSTSFATTLCYVPTNTGVAACGKRKRRRTIEEKPKSLRAKHMHISRSQLDDWKIEDDDREANMDRDARMMLYWVTTTMTTTSYTATSTLATIACTPSDWDIPTCG